MITKHLCDNGDFYTNSGYWDCHCEENYIHKATPMNNAECKRCGAIEEEQPDARQNEIESGLFFATDI